MTSFSKRTPDVAPATVRSFKELTSINMRFNLIIWTRREEAVLDEGLKSGGKKSPGCKLRKVTSSIGSGWFSKVGICLGKRTAADDQTSIIHSERQTTTVSIIEIIKQIAAEQNGGLRLRRWTLTSDVDFTLDGIRTWPISQVKQISNAAGNTVMH